MHIIGTEVDMEQIEQVAIDLMNALRELLSNLVLENQNIHTMSPETKQELLEERTALKLTINKLRKQEKAILKKFPHLMELPEISSHKEQVEAIGLKIKHQAKANLEKTAEKPPMPKPKVQPAKSKRPLLLEDDLE